MHVPELQIAAQPPVETVPDSVAAPAIPQITEEQLEAYFLLEERREAAKAIEAAVRESFEQAILAAVEASLAEENLLPSSVYAEEITKLRALAERVALHHFRTSNQKTTPIGQRGLRISERRKIIIDDRQKLVELAIHNNWRYLLDVNDQQIKMEFEHHRNTGRELPFTHEEITPVLSILKKI